MKTLIIIILLAIIAGGIYNFFYKAPEQPALVYKDLIRIDTPKQNDVITNPVLVSGEARGNWYFEASFPTEILDEDGTVLAQVPVQAQGEWMTEEYVSFSATIYYKEPKGKRGSIIFRKDNPSGEARFDDSVTIPVKFK